MAGRNVLFMGEKLSLVLFYDWPVLWIHTRDQLYLPKMEFVGGHPADYCIFIEKLSEEEKKQITSLEGEVLDIDKEIEMIFRQREIEEQQLQIAQKKYMEEQAKLGLEKDKNPKDRNALSPKMKELLAKLKG